MQKNRSGRRKSKKKKKIKETNTSETKKQTKTKTPKHTTQNKEETTGNLFNLQASRKVKVITSLALT